jgi:DNA mismatch endonuclease (patch repair protein)
MKAVRQRDTALELAVRQFLHAHGVRYRVCPRNLPGRPDLANARRRWAIFVHGCFWHGHACRLGTKPKANAEWWRAKIDANRERDARKKNQLEALGFHVFTVWQCEVEDGATMHRRLDGVIERSQHAM